MTSSRKMADFGSFEAIMRDLNDKILQMTPFSSSNFHDLAGGTVKTYRKLLKNLAYRDLH